MIYVVNPFVDAMRVVGERRYAKSCCKPINDNKNAAAFHFCTSLNNKEDQPIIDLGCTELRGSRYAVFSSEMSGVG